MKIDIRTPGVHHISLRSSDLLRSKRFYAETLGFPVILEKENLFIFLAGSTAIGVPAPENATPKDDVFNPFRVGLDHLALEQFHNSCGHKPLPRGLSLGAC